MWKPELITLASQVIMAANHRDIQITWVETKRQAGTGRGELRFFLLTYCPFYLLPPFFLRKFAFESSGHWISHFSQPSRCSGSAVLCS